MTHHTVIQSPIMTEASQIALGYFQAKAQIEFTEINLDEVEVILQTPPETIERGLLELAAAQVLHVARDVTRPQILVVRAPDPDAFDEVLSPSDYALAATALERSRRAGREVV